MRGILVSLLLTGVLFQAAPAKDPIRIGPTAGQLTSDDVDQINRLLREVGGTPWVFRAGSPAGPARSDGVPWYVGVYFAPERATGRLRRGRVRSLSATLPTYAAYSAPKTWRLESRSGEYVQVPVPGTQPDYIVSSRDLNRPFSVSGALVDEAILEIVEVLRRSPVIPAPNAARGATVDRRLTHVEGTWPIASMTLRDDGTVNVSLWGNDPDEHSGQDVTLRRSANTWTVVSLGFWVV